MAQPEFTPLDLPAQYRDASDASAAGQRSYLLLTRLRLASLVVAALAGSISCNTGSGTESSSPEWAGIVGALAFVLAVVFESWILKSRPERRWYAGRAAAESVKTVAWRYSVGGAPFAIDTPGTAGPELKRQFVERLGAIEDITREARALPGDTPRDQLTQKMQETRLLPLRERQEIYAKGRIANQCEWYANNARICKRYAGASSAVLLTLEAGGAAAAIGKAAGLWAFDTLGVIGALTAAVAAWVAIKQYSSLSAAYAVASNELSRISVELADIATEEQWAKFVDQSEEAISREHTLWLASRSDDAALLRAAHLSPARR